MKKKILFVDDEADWRLIPPVLLEDTGYEVITAKDATETVLRTEGVTLDLIILDVNLGRDNAPDLLKLLRVCHPRVPIFLYTGLPLEDKTVQAMLGGGADRYLRKGTMNELLEQVQSVLEPSDMVNAIAQSP